MSINRFRVEISASHVPAAGSISSSRHRYRVGTGSPAPPVVDTRPASPVSSGSFTNNASASMRSVAEDSDSSTNAASVVSAAVSVLSISSSSADEFVAPVRPVFDRSIPTRRELLPEEVDFPTFSTSITARFPVLSVVQANIIDYDTTCRYT